MELGLRVYHKEYFPPPQRIASVWQCIDHRRTGKSLCWDEQADHLYICWTTEGQGRCIVEGHSSVCAIYCVCRRGPHKSVCLLTITDTLSERGKLRQVGLTCSLLGRFVCTTLDSTSPRRIHVWFSLINILRPITICISSTCRPTRYNVLWNTIHVNQLFFKSGPALGLTVEAPSHLAI